MIRRTLIKLIPVSLVSVMFPRFPEIKESGDRLIFDEGTVLKIHGLDKCGREQSEDIILSDYSAVTSVFTYTQLER